MREEKEMKPATDLECPQCNRKWCESSEQGQAIVKRGKCIVCLMQDDERIEQEPYEFENKCGIASEYCTQCIAKHNGATL